MTSKGSRLGNLNLNFKLKVSFLSWKMCLTGDITASVMSKLFQILVANITSMVAEPCSP